MNMRLIFLYLVLLVVSFLIGAMFWHWQMAGTYFFCKHHGVILDFAPPFVHPSQAGTGGDFFVKPQAVVYTIWAVYVAVILIVPAVAVWLGYRVYERDLKKSWM